MKLTFIIYAINFLIINYALDEKVDFDGPNINSFNNLNQYKNVEIGYSSSDYAAEDSSIPNSYDNFRCMDNNKISYEFCNSKRNCNICSLSYTCAWCVKQNRCVPVNTEKMSLCDDNCGGLVKLEQCHSLYIRKYIEQFEQKDNMKKPQFLPSEIERKYHYGINNEVYSKILKETLENSTEGISPAVSSKFRFKQQEHSRKKIKKVKINEQGNPLLIKPEKAAENIMSFLDDHLS